MAKHSTVLLLLVAFFSVRADSRLVVSENGRFFYDEGRPVVLFGGGLWTVIPDVTVDVEEHNSWLERWGANANRATLFAFFNSVADGEGLAPWERTGPGTANDGGLKFDLGKPGERFWQRVHDYLQSCERHGIYTLLQIFDEPFTEAGKERWKNNPFNPENHVNPIPGLPGGKGSGEEAFYDPENRELMAIQDALVRRLLDETAIRHGNAIYEIGNEINMDSMTPKAESWQKHWIRFFKAYEEEKGVSLLLSNDTRKDLFVAAEGGFDVVNHHGFLRCPIEGSQHRELAQCIFKGIEDDFGRFHRPILNSRPCSDPDRTNYRDIVSEETGRRLYWSYFVGGGHIIGFRTTDESLMGGEAAERIIQNLRRFIDSTRYWEMEPRADLVEGDALCLSCPGKQYVLYFPSGGKATVDLKQPKVIFNLRWYNPRAGVFQEPERVSGEETVTFAAPDENDWALLLEAANSN